MKNKYSLNDLKEKKQKKKSNVDKVYNKTKGIKLYLGTILGFLILGTLIIFSPLFLGKSYDYQSVKLNDAMNITSSLNLFVDDMEMNRDKGLFKLVVRYEDETGAKSLSNLKSDYKLNYITNKGNDKVKTEVITLSEEYTVIYYKNIPKDFGVISVTVLPRYKYPDLEPSNDLKDKEIKFYAVDNKIKENSSLKIENKNNLQKNTLKYQSKLIKEAIENEIKEVEKLKLSNKLTNKDIKKLEQGMDFETEEGQLEIKNDVNSRKNNIETNNKLIAEIEEKIKQLENKNKMLEKKYKNFENK